MACCDDPDVEDQDGRDDEDRHSGPPHPGLLNIHITIPGSREVGTHSTSLTFSKGKWQLCAELKVELEVVELVEGWIIHIGRAGRIDSSQQQAIPNFIF